MTCNPLEFCDSILDSVHPMSDGRYFPDANGNLIGVATNPPAEQVLTDQQLRSYVRALVIAVPQAPRILNVGEKTSHANAWMQERSRP